MGDVTNRGSVTTLFEAGTPENVFYLAAETGTGRSLTNCGLNATVNTVGIANFLDVMAALTEKPKYVALTSTRGYTEKDRTQVATVKLYTRANVVQVIWKSVNLNFLTCTL